MNVTYVITSTIENLAELAAKEELIIESPAEAMAERLGGLLFRHHLRRKLTEPEDVKVAAARADYVNRIYHCPKCGYHFTDFELPITICPRPACGGILEIAKGEKEPGNGE